MTCSACGAEVLDIDMKCGACGATLAATGANKMLGTVVLGQYELIDILGQGGMSVVFKGRHNMTAQEVALKILPPELAAHSQVKGRFLEEAKALAALDHPNIVHLYTFGQENGCFVLAMQFVQGRTWERLIIENKRLGAQLSAKIAVDVLRALEYAHGRGVVHRDMKPSNVLVRDHDQSATVMDFGIAKMTTSTKLTATGQTMGTVRYMSPEQVRGQEVDARTDIYSLGATLYESLTGETPFDGQTHFEIMTKHLGEPPRRPTTLGIAVPLALEDALMRSLAKRAEDRFQTARDMRLAIESAMRAADIGLHETQPVSRKELAASMTDDASSRSTPAPRASQSLAPSARTPASPTELAQALAPPGRRRGVPWLAIGVFVALAGGGGSAAYVLLRDHARPPVTKPPPAPVAPHDPELRGNPRVGEAQLRDSYKKAFDSVQKVMSDLSLTLQHPVVERVVVVEGHGGMCDASKYGGPFVVGTSCDKELSAVANNDPSTLLVIDDPTQLDAAMREGIAFATNTFQTFTVDHTPAGEQAEARNKIQAALQARLQDYIDGAGAPAVEHPRPGTRP
jgi:serine/threonine protein kinase